MIWSGQFETDKYIVEYFPTGYKGVAIDVGAVDGRYMSNTLYLEEILDWEVLCIEPNPFYYNKLIGNRKYCMGYAISNTIADSVDFFVFKMGDGNKSSISSLSPDKKLIDYHKDIYGIVFENETIKVDVRTLDYCIQYFPTDRIDLVSIDTEGTELSVLKGFDIDKWKPKLFVIEDNWEESTKVISEYLERFNYVFDMRIGVNDFFVRRGYESTSF